MIPRHLPAFAELVGDAERLRCLYVHTFCDSRGTSVGPLEQLQGHPPHHPLPQHAGAPEARRRHRRQPRGKAKDDPTGTHRPDGSPGSATTRSPRISACFPTAISSRPTRARSRCTSRWCNKLLKSITATDSVGLPAARDRLEGRPEPLAHGRQRRDLGPGRALLQARRRLQRRRA